MQVNNFYEYEPYEFRGMISYNIDNLKFFFADLPRVLVEILIIIFVSRFYITSISAEVFGFIFICIIIYVISYLLTRKVLHNLSEERYTLDKKYYDKIISICKNIDEFFFNAGIPHIKNFLSSDFNKIKKNSEKKEGIESFSNFVTQSFSSIIILLIYILLRTKISVGVLLMTISFAQIIFPLIQTLFEMVNYYIDLKPCINEAMNLDKISLQNEKMILYTKNRKENYFVKNLTVQFSEKQIINNLSLEFKRNGLYIIQGSNWKR